MPQQCTFEVIGFGPIHPEQKTFEDHRPLRDEVESVEFEIACALRSRGCDVIGVHQCACKLPSHTESLIKTIEAKLASEFGLRDAVTSGKGR